MILKIATQIQIDTNNIILKTFYVLLPKAKLKTIVDIVKPENLPIQMVFNNSTVIVVTTITIRQIKKIINLFFIKLNSVVTFTIPRQPANEHCIDFNRFI